MKLIIFTLLLLCAVVFLYFYAKKGGNEKQFIQIIGVIALGLLLIAIADFILSAFAASYVKDLAQTELGLSPLLANVVYFSVFVIVGLSYWFFVHQKRSLNLFTILLIGIGPAIVYLALYFGSKDWTFNPTTGEATKCYVVTAKGVITHKVDIAKPFYDPVTGKPCKPFTAEMNQKLEVLDAKLKSGQKIEAINPKSAQWFSAATGEPMLWFSKKGKDTYEFYDLPGFNPRTGAQLEPVTSAMQAQWTNEVTQKEASVIETQ